MNLTLDVALCKSMIGGVPGYWENAAACFAACMAQEPLRHLQQKLENALTVRHIAEDGTAILQQGMDYLAQNLPEHLPLYPAAALAALLPQAIRYYQMLNTPPDVIRATFADMPRWMDAYAAVHGGTQGLNEITWLIHPYAGTIYEIGSLQFQTIRNPFPYFGYLVNGKIQLLPAAGLAVDAAGYLCGTNGKHLDVAFTTTLAAGGETLRGNTVDVRRGTILPQQTAVPKGCPLLMAPFQPILNIHIPEGADLSPQAVDASLRAAKAFFTAQSYPCRAAVCDSWLFDAQLAPLLPPHSRIAAFSARFSLFPVCCEQFTLGRFLFGYDFEPEHLERVTPTSTLQKGVYRALQAGGEFYDTGGLVLL